MSEKRNLAIGATSIPEGVWLKNEIFYETRRSLKAFTIGLVTFAVVLSISGFIATGNVAAFLTIPVGLMSAMIAYAMFLTIPQYVRISENGLQLQYQALWSSKIFLWEQTKTIRVKKMPQSASKSAERYLLKFRDRRNRSLTTIPIPLSPDVYRAARDASRIKNPNVIWQHT